MFIYPDILLYKIEYLKCRIVRGVGTFLAPLKTSQKLAYKGSTRAGFFFNIGR